MLDRIARPATPAREFIVDFQLVIRTSTEAGAQEPLESGLNRLAGKDDTAEAHLARESPDTAGTAQGRENRF